jgi:hypothetical protein
MLDAKYQEQITAVALSVLGADAKLFIFGSSLGDGNFNDVDLALDSDVSDQALRQLKEALHESTLPYKVDVINFKQTDEAFKANVLNSKILWLT